MRAKTPKFWQSTSALAVMLYPLSLLFRVIVAIRRQCYRSGLLRSIAVDTPVIVVGNITAGGAGKTPLVIALVEHLQTMGKKVGVLSGGYGGSARGGHPLRVNSSTDPSVAGDEALVIARHTNAPVVVAKDRASGAQLLQTQCDYIICDDGLQHYRLKRDVEIVVVDSERRFGNGWMLPAGPLREPTSRLQSVSLVCYSGQNHPSPGYQLQADELVNVRNGARTPLASSGRRVHAVAGIAYPEKFFSMLKAHGFDLIEHALADHQAFDSDMLQFDEDLPIIMTEKDAVKCSGFAPENAWYLTVSVLPDEELLEKFDRLIGSQV